MVGALSGACSSETVAMWPAPPAHFQTHAARDRTSSPVTPTDKERTLAQVYTTALESPGFDSLSSILDEQAHIAFGTHNTHGRARVLKGYDDMFGAFDQRRFTTSRVWLTDSTHPLDTQAVEWTMQGVQARDWLGVSATGKPIVIKGVTLLWTSDDGVVTDSHVYFDEDVARAELGSGPPELRKLPVPRADAESVRVIERSGRPEETANVAAFRAMLQALQDGREADFLSTMTDDIAVSTSDRAEPVRGKPAAHDYFKTMRSSIHHLDTVIQNAWGVQSFTVVEYAITGLQRAPLPRIAFAEGRGLHAQFVDIAEFRDGRMAHIWRYADPVAFGSP